VVPIFKNGNLEEDRRSIGRPPYKEGFSAVARPGQSVVQRVWELAGKIDVGGIMTENRRVLEGVLSFDRFSIPRTE
jgi:hypothetical protein